jgi:histidinol-phosphate aminotransferase
MKSQRPAWVDRFVASHVISIPPYVPGKPIAELKRKLGIQHAIKMASNENPLGPSPAAVNALRESLKESNIYPESSAPVLRSALARSFNVSPDSVILGNGSDEIMEMCAHVFITPGDEAIMADTTFSMYQICVEAFGGTAVTVPLRNYKFDLKAIASAVTERTRLIFLAIPNSPTGTIVSQAEFDSFIKDLPTDRLVLIVDEAYREYVSNGDCPNGIAYLEKPLPVLVLRTFSKIYGLAGLRVGYGFAESWLIELLNRVRPPFNVNSLAQVAALAALDDKDHVERTLRMTREGIQFLSQELKKLGAEVILSEANFVCFCMGYDAAPIYNALLQRGIIVRHLASFGMDQCIRVTVGLKEDNVRFINALKNIVGRS